MKPNIFDEAFDILKERMDDAFGKLQSEFKGKKPFGKEPYSVEDQIYDYNTRGYEIFERIANEQGLETAIQYQDTMKAEIAKRSR